MSVCHREKGIHVFPFHPLLSFEDQPCDALLFKITDEIVSSKEEKKQIVEAFQVWCFFILSKVSKTTH